MTSDALFTSPARDPGPVEVAVVLLADSWPDFDPVHRMILADLGRAADIARQWNDGAALVRSANALRAAIDSYRPPPAAGGVDSGTEHAGGIPDGISGPAVFDA